MLINLSPLRNKNFRNLFLGQLISGFGTQMTAITIPFQVYALTHSTFYTGLVSALEFVFILGVGLIGGVFADTKEKRKLLLVSEACLGLITLVFAWNAFSAQASLALIFVLSALSSALTGVHRPALESLTPRIVAKEDIAKVSALMPMRNILMMIISPSIAGFCIAKFGAGFSYLVNFTTFFISFFFLLRLPQIFPVREDSEQKLKPLQSIVEGMKYVRSRQELIGTYLIDFIAIVFCMPHSLFPALAEAYQRTESLGFLYAAPALGGFLVSMFSKWTLSVQSHGRCIILAASLWSFSIAMTGLAFGFNTIVLGLMLAGAFDMVSGIFRMTIWNQTIPDALRGRLASFEMIGYMAGPLLGNAVCGFMADFLGLHTALLYGGLLSVFCIILASFRLPIFWNYKGPGTQTQALS